MPHGMGTITLIPYVTKYLAGRVARGEITKRTAACNRSVLGGLAVSFGRRPVRTLSESHIEAWLATRGHVEKSTRRLEYSVVRGFVRWLQRTRVIRHDPMVNLTAPPSVRSVPRALPIDEVRRLWNELPDQRARVIVLLMMECGLRRVEVSRAQLGDWDRIGGLLRVVGKGGHERLVPIPEHVAAQLSTYVAEVGVRSGPLIRSRLNDHDGISPHRIGELMARWMRAANVKIAAYDGRGCHSLRHTAASDLADVEPDLRVIQEFLGHAHLTSTQIYLRRVGLARMRAAMEARATARRRAPAERSKRIRNQQPYGKAA